MAAERQTPQEALTPQPKQELIASETQPGFRRLVIYRHDKAYVPSDRPGFFRIATSTFVNRPVEADSSAE